MSDQFFIFTSNEAREPNACQEYRIRVPLLQLAKMYPEVKVYEDDGQRPVEAVQAMIQADLCQFYSLGGEEVLHKTRVLNEMKASELDGKMIYPPALVYDVDDNSDFVHPFNRTFVHLGVRSYPDVRLLTPDDAGLEWSDSKGRRTVLWEDGKTESIGMTFDIARNLKEMKVRHQIIRECQGATVSSRALQSYFTDVIGQKNTYIFPNTVVPSNYEQIEVVRKDPEAIRILWQGSESHYVDWYPLRDAIKEITEKYPQVKWVIFGQWFDWVHDVIPDERVEHHDWVAYPAFKLKRGLLNADINLCPLANNPFNRCKSAIKWYEATIWDKPEPTLAARVEPYHEIEDGVTGLLYSTPAEFVQKLSLLIEDADLRARLADAAKKWVLENRTPEKTIPGLMDFYQECRNIRKAPDGGLIVPGSTREIKRLVQQEKALRGHKR
jgi:glycosyltransferase involved in cell wall biosynthesis